MLSLQREPRNKKKELLNLPNGVDVQISGTTLTKSVLHCRLRVESGRSGRVEPIRVLGARCACELPCDGCVGVACVHHLDLVGELAVTG